MLATWLSVCYLLYTYCHLPSNLWLPTFNTFNTFNAFNTYLLRWQQRALETVVCAKKLTLSNLDYDLFELSDNEAVNALASVMSIKTALT